MRLTHVAAAAHEIGVGTRSSVHHYLRRLVVNELLADEII
jgi:hypothetical protein